MGKSASSWDRWAGMLALVGGLAACSSAKTENGGNGGQAGLGAAGSSTGASGTGGGSGGTQAVADAGDGGQDVGCVPSTSKCKPTFECGTVDDGCGERVECGTCAGDRLCSEHECVTQCVGCVDGSTCIGDGGSPLAQPCLECDAASGKLVPRTQGICDDGNACTTSDHCDAGNCTGTNKACSDGVACNGEETCDGQSGQCVAGSPTCQTGLCDLAHDGCVAVCKGCTIDQTCYENGALNPGNPCQACRVESDATGWTITAGASCGPDDTCQFNHVCSAAGQCQFDAALAGKPCAGASPNTTCASYACDGHGSCAVQLADTATPCGTPAPCRKQDHCDGQGNCEAGGPQALGFACKQFGACAGAASAPTCDCLPGAQSSGAACVDVNECTSNTDTCDSQPDACVNDVLGFHCTCPGNFSGAGIGQGSCSCAHTDWSPLCEPWSQVALQSSHACGLSGGALFCWGVNDEGQLGTGDRTDRYRPTRIGAAKDWDRVAVGNDQSCGIRAGALYCWGNNGVNKLGIGNADSKVPQRVGADSDWIALSASVGSQCGIRQGGALYCWGYNGHGQLGLGSTGTFVTAPALVPTLGGVTTVSVKNDSTCAVAAGKLYCWGDNTFGELGTGPTTGDVTSPVLIAPFEDFLSVDAGVGVSCATRAGGSLYCWGSGYELTPTQLGVAAGWQVVSSGIGARCALTQSGSAYCWGANSEGAVGDGTSQPRSSPTAIASGQQWEQIVVGKDTSCGIHDGGLYCWGSNEDGIRGTGFRDDLVGTDTDWTRVAAGFRYTCALKSSGQLYCWGGYPGSADRVAPWTPVLIGQASDHDWTSVEAGLFSTCAIKSGDAYCWGSNSDGQVGTGDKVDVPAPTRVGPTGLWQRFGLGDAHTCGIRDGNLYCWGRDDYGQIGNGSLPGSTTPELVASAGWTQVAAGSRHSCAIKSGAMYCWGDNGSGQVGAGGASSNTPQRVGSASNWLGVFAGNTLSCGIQQGGVLSCWGEGKNATTVPGAKPWRSADAGLYGTCAVQTDDKLYCWGLNQHGQLGTGDTVYTTSPVPSVPTANFDSVTVDFNRVCGLTTQGSIRCWGSNAGGALGRSEGLLPMPIIDPNQD